jgi:hypothetical protein
MLTFMVSCVLLPGCSLNPHPSQDNPREYGYHFHPMSLGSRAYNWPTWLDSVAVVEVKCGFLHTQRPGDGIYAAALGFSAPVVLLLKRCDTVSVCTTGCEHLTGYQLRVGGDTTHLGLLDSCPGWSVVLSSVRATAIAVSGARYSANSVDLLRFPDTVRASQAIDVELDFEMEGFLTWAQSGQNPLVADGAYVTVRQR